VPWEEFSKRFYQYLGISLPEKNRRRYSEIFARTNYLCLKTILTNGTITYINFYLNNSLFIMIYQYY
jgi:hypothetical protein